MTHPLRIVARQAVLGLLALLAGCSALQPPAEGEIPPDLTFDQLRVRQYRRGALSANATFEKLEYVRDESKAIGHRTVIKPVENGQGSTTTITAGESIGTLKEGMVELGKGVAYETSGGDRTETEACTVNLVSRTATGNLPVAMSGIGYKVDAAGFDANFRHETEFHLRGGVHSVLEDVAPPAPPPTPPVRPSSTRRSK